MVHVLNVERRQRWLSEGSVWGYSEKVPTATGNVPANVEQKDAAGLWAFGDLAGTLGNCTGRGCCICTGAEGICRGGIAHAVQQERNGFARNDRGRVAIGEKGSQRHVDGVMRAFLSVPEKRIGGDGF
jgi:hypothetical protein